MSGDITSAGERLRLIQDYFLAPGGGAPRAERTARATEPAAAIRLDVYDHMMQTVQEVTDLAQELRADDAPCVPPAHQRRDVYEWLVEKTDHLSPARQQARDALIYRQGLEHALVMGEANVIRRHPCPACTTWGLMWDRSAEEARCTNLRCADDEGQAATWTLAQIAEHHVARRNSCAARAT
ncbi:hypothetical protein [Streptomyces hydrogenans]|uniref:hypothetical protein n=1 Tax=Streptomyces hydrogenans TaxID=1873719 RepID=UPI0036ED0C7D